MKGQKSIDPTVFFRMMLICYLENIISDRTLIEHISTRLDRLYLIDYETFGHHFLFSNSIRSQF